MTKNIEQVDDNKLPEEIGEFTLFCCSESMESKDWKLFNLFLK